MFNLNNLSEAMRKYFYYEILTDLSRSAPAHNINQHHKNVVIV